MQHMWPNMASPQEWRTTLARLRVSELSQVRLKLLS